MSERPYSWADLDLDAHRIDEPAMAWLIEKAAKRERERIIKILESQLCACIADKTWWDGADELFEKDEKAYYAKYDGHANCGYAHIERSIELIKGENK